MFGHIRGDTLADGYFLAEHTAGGLFWREIFHHPRGNSAPRQVTLQQFMHLAQFHIVIGNDGEAFILALDGAVAILEIETLVDFSAHAVKRVIHLREIGAGDNIK